MISFLQCQELLLSFLFLFLFAQTQLGVAVEWINLPHYIPELNFLCYFSFEAQHQTLFPILKTDHGFTSTYNVLFRMFQSFTRLTFVSSEPTNCLAILKIIHFYIESKYTNLQLLQALILFQGICEEVVEKHSLDLNFYPD